jgi:GcrA cell cycle regulator
MNWTDERVELLRKLWSEGLSASQIAAQLGSVTRNAVIGKVHRLKLSSRGRTTAAAPRQKKTSSVVSGGTKSVSRASTVTRSITTSIGATALQTQFEAVPVVRYRPAEDVVVPISRRLQLVQLSERTCKWPNGDPLTEDFSFCGNDTAETGPYCTYHSRVAFQPAAERRRNR